MKYKDNHKHLNSVRNKYGNVNEDTRDWRANERKRRRNEAESKRSFLIAISNIDSYWMKTLSDDDIKDLFVSWSYNQEIKNAPNGCWFGAEPGDGMHDSLKDFVEYKKLNYGSIKEARDLKIKDLIKD